MENNSKVFEEAPTTVRYSKGRARTEVEVSYDKKAHEIFYLFFPHIAFKDKERLIFNEDMHDNNHRTLTCALIHVELQIKYTNDKKLKDYWEGVKKALLNYEFKS